MKVMIGYDGTPEARSALSWAGKCGARLGAEVVVVWSVRSDSQGGEHGSGEARRGLAEAEQTLRDSGLPCRGILSGRGLYPGEDLAGLAKEEGADLLVVGARNRSKLGKLVLGSVAQYVILNAPCPVVTVKAETR